MGAFAPKTDTTLNFVMSFDSWIFFKIPKNTSILSKTTFWLDCDTKEEIYKILKKKHKINKKDVEWIKQETPPFVGE